MKVAVAANDKSSISQHFGRSASWLIFEVEDENIRMTERRTNQHRHDAAGCHSGKEDHGTHSHVGLIEALKDCEALITAGIGWRAAEDLKRNGIQPFSVSLPCTPEEAVLKYSRGGLSPAGQVYCREHGSGHDRNRQKDLQV